MANWKHRYLGAAALAWAVLGCAHGPDTGGAFALRPGDLLFQDIDCGPLCDAIEQVTEGVDGADFSHVGMVSRTGREGVFVIEAVSAGVVETPLDAFLARSADAAGRPKVLVGRLTSEKASLIDGAIAAARGHLGKPYDRIYAMSDESLYCSELLYHAFGDANGGEPIFDLYPMTFRDPESGATFPPWAAYYDGLGAAIPEGEPGLNPGGMSRSPGVEIVHAFGRPDGWRPRR